MWSHFYKATWKDKQNSSHYVSYCKGCVKREKQRLQVNGTFDQADWTAEGQSFRDACEQTTGVRGAKEPWVTHILGGRTSTACPHASEAAIQEATSIRDGMALAKKQKVGDVHPAATMALAEAAASSTRKHDRSTSASDDPQSKRLKQGVFQVFDGINAPFSPAAAEGFKAQALRATISAGLAFSVWEDAEVQELFRLARTTAPELLPSGKVNGGRLLNEAAESVEAKVKEALQGKEIGLGCDGWRARTKADVSGLCANVDFKVYTLELTDMTSQNKDGEALRDLFGSMIDRVEKKYHCYVIYFITDADGGSKKGRILLGKQRPWLLVPSCWAHQFQLILGDYFKVYPYAAEIAEQATGLIAWINNHGKVRKIFDNSQAQLSTDRLGFVLVLAYLVANLTRWTTHFIAFVRLISLQEALQFAVLQSRGAIIAAQVGAAKSTEAQKLREEAEYFCDLIRDSSFWNGLTAVASDIEPICFGTNLGQQDSCRADKVILSLAGLYLHYIDHPEPEVSKALVARIEKRWKDCDQPLFLVALILNPFEGLTRFGPLANFDHFKATALVTELYRRINSYPGNDDTAQQRVQNEQRLTQSMFEYLSSTGPFQGWESAREEFERSCGRDPIRVWTALERSAGELAPFAITILKVVVNQAGCERVFSDVGNMQSPRRSRLQLQKLDKMAKIGASIKADHIAQGIPSKRRARKNHKSVEKLLAVPRYRFLLEEQEEDSSQQRHSLFSSRADWRIEMAQWIADAQEAEDEELAEQLENTTDSVEDFPEVLSTAPTTSHPSRKKPRKWVNTTLAVLFGNAPNPVRARFSKKQIDAEAELMEALAEAEEDARPDDGAIECSDDEYVP
ncbi:ribonuclease H-like domain-containing protein [Favolaschia claudopus]|uniref:Ribonuclease H-like domain-containing protein n=1 Tax=Favolaschia claudopus TaxID=2862362 RepID=A0AAW0CY89_9AGAR